MNRLYRREPHSCDSCRKIIVDNFELPHGQPRTTGHDTGSPPQYVSKPFSHEEASRRAEDGCLLFKEFVTDARARPGGILTLSLTYWSNWRSEAQYDGDLRHLTYSWRLPGEDPTVSINSGHWNACAIEGKALPTRSSVQAANAHPMPKGILPPARCSRARSSDAGERRARSGGRGSGNATSRTRSAGRERMRCRHDCCYSSATMGLRNLHCVSSPRPQGRRFRTLL